MTNFVWDWASGIPEMLSDGDNLYLVGHETLGQWDDASPGGAEEWTYYLPDALGSIRQTTDEAGSVTASREWTPFGVELALSGAEGVGAGQAGLGYTGEWQDSYAEFLYLRARWYDNHVGRFTQQDPWMGDIYQPPTLIQDYAYVRGNPVRWIDPTGMTEQWWEDMLRDTHWRQVFLDSASRHNSQAATGFTNEGFGAILASVVLIEGGNLGGASDNWKRLIGKHLGPRPESIRVPIVACVKWMEIVYNRKLDHVSPIGREGQSIWDYLRYTIGYQSEGIVNVNRDIVEQAQQAGIEIYYYDESETYSGLNWPLIFLRGQEQWIEYLATSFELVTQRAQLLDVDLSAKNEHDWHESLRAFGQWHDRGIVEAFGVEGNWYDDETLAEIEKSNPAWVADQRADQDSATRYYQKLISHWWAAHTGLTE